MKNEIETVIIYEASKELAEITEAKTVSSAELKSILVSIVEKVKSITATDLSDEKALEEVKTTRIKLGKIRTAIAKQSKEKRDVYTLLAGKNREIELSLIGIIDPEEERLKAIEDEAKKIKELKDREVLLPMREHALNALKDGIEVTKEFLLSMENEEFTSYLNQRTSAKNEADRASIEAEKAKLARDAEDKRIAEEAVKAERERIEAQNKVDEVARVNAEVEKKALAESVAQKLIDDAKLERERADAQSKLEAQKLIDDANAKAEQMLREIEEEKLAKEKAEQERLAKEKEEQEKKEKNKKYTKFLSDNDFNKETDKIERVENTFTIYRKVAEVVIE